MRSSVCYRTKARAPKAKKLRPDAANLGAIPVKETGEDEALPLELEPEPEPEPDVPGPELEEPEPEEPESEEPEPDEPEPEEPEPDEPDPEEPELPFDPLPAPETVPFVVFVYLPTLPVATTCGTALTADTVCIFNVVGTNDGCEETIGVGMRRDLGDWVCERMGAGTLVGPSPEPMGVSSLEILVGATSTVAMTVVGPSPEPTGVRARTEVASARKGTKYFIIVVRVGRWSSGFVLAE